MELLYIACFLIIISIFLAYEVKAIINGKVDYVEDNIKGSRKIEEKYNK